MRDRHKTWDELDALFVGIASHIGYSVFDYRCDKWLDVGQAICAEAYGEDWENNETFLRWNNLPASDPVEPHYFNCAVKMANGYIPEWCIEKTYTKNKENSK